MASGVKLVYTFTDADGKKVQYSYNHAQTAATAAQVNAVATALITNTAILAKTLVTIDKIVRVTTSESEYDISENALATKKAPEVINGNPEPTETGENTVVEIKRI